MKNISFLKIALLSLTGIVSVKGMESNNHRNNIHLNFEKKKESKMVKTKKVSDPKKIVINSQEAEEQIRNIRNECNKRQKELALYKKQEVRKEAIQDKQEKIVINSQEAEEQIRNIRNESNKKQKELALYKEKEARKEAIQDKQEKIVINSQEAEEQIRNIRNECNKRQKELALYKKQEVRKEAIQDKQEKIVINSQEAEEQIRNICNESNKRQKELALYKEKEARKEAIQDRIEDIEFAYKEIMEIINVLEQKVYLIRKAGGEGTFSYKTTIIHHYEISKMTWSLLDEEKALLSKEGVYNGKSQLNEAILYINGYYSDGGYSINEKIRNYYKQEKILINNQEAEKQIRNIRNEYKERQKELALYKGKEARKEEIQDRILLIKK